MRSQPVVSRSYKLSEDACIRALKLLLKQSASNEGGPATAPDDGTKIKEDSASASIRE